MNVHSRRLRSGDVPLDLLSGPLEQKVEELEKRLVKLHEENAPENSPEARRRKEIDDIFNS